MSLTAISHPLAETQTHLFTLLKTKTSPFPNLPERLKQKQKESGNKKFHSIETLNIYITDTILEAMDKKRLTALVLLDLSKTIDGIDHIKLLHKLSMVGASTAVVNWFKSYLSGRPQCTRRASTLSDPLPITHGVLYPKVLYSHHCCFASI